MTAPSQSYRMNLQPGTWIYRSSSRVEPDGTPWTAHYRRQIVFVDKGQAQLSAMEQATCPADSAPTDWRPHGGLLGGPAVISVARLRGLMRSQGWRVVNSL